MPWTNQPDHSQHYSFTASASGWPAPAPPVEETILDPGYHVETGGVEQAFMLASATVLILWHFNRWKSAMPSRRSAA